MIDLWQSLHCATVPQKWEEHGAGDTLGVSLPASSDSVDQISAWKQDILDAVESSTPSGYSCGKPFRLHDGLLELYVPTVSKGGLTPQNPTGDAFWVGAYPGRPCDEFINSTDPSVVIGTRQKLEVRSARLYPGIHSGPGNGATLKGTAEEILRSLGLDAGVETFTAYTQSPVFSSEFLRWAKQNPIRGIEIRHGAGKNHELVYRPFIKAWLSRFPHAPPMRFVADTAARHPDRWKSVATPSTAALIGDALAHTLSGESAVVPSDEVMTTINTAFCRGSTSPASRPMWDPASRVQFFLEQPPDQIVAGLDEVSRRKGIADIIAAHREIGVLSPLMCDGLSYLLSRFAPDCLQNTDLKLHAKVLDDAYSLFMGLSCFGARTNVSMSIAEESDSGLLYEMLRRWRVATFTPSRKDEFYRRKLSHHHYRTVGKTVWLKVGDSAKHIGRDGDHRFVIQNTSDLSKFGASTWPHVKVNDVILKEVESKLAGHKNTLIAAREIRHTWGVRAADVVFNVVGAGYIGANIVESLLQRGMDPKNIRIIDPDPKVRERFCECQTFADISEVRDGGQRNYTFVATPPEVLSLNTLRSLGTQQIVHSLVSGDRCISARERRLLRDTSDPHLRKLAHAKDWYAGLSSNSSERPKNFPDRIWVPDPGRFIKFLCDFRAPNLVEPHWPQRAEVTSLALLTGILLANDANAQSPDKIEVAAEINRELGAIAERHGVLDFVPLDNRGGDTTEAEQLRLDLDSFSPERPWHGR